MTYLGIFICKKNNCHSGCLLLFISQKNNIFLRNLLLDIELCYKAGKCNCLYQKYDKMKETRRKRSLLLFALKRETNSFCIGYGVQCKICNGMLLVM